MTCRAAPRQHELVREEDAFWNPDGGFIYAFIYPVHFLAATHLSTCVTQVILTATSQSRHRYPRLTDEDTQASADGLGNTRSWSL